jgi:DNA replicative helicase MCM subunit Mcm2 (Cdc46/Mcm family)
MKKIKIKKVLNAEALCGIDLDCSHLLAWAEATLNSEELYLQLRDYPSEMLPIADTALNTIARRIIQNSMQGLEAPAKDLFMRPFNLPENPVDLRKLDPWGRVSTRGKKTVMKGAGNVFY